MKGNTLYLRDNYVPMSKNRNSRTYWTLSSFILAFLIILGPWLPLSAQNQKETFVEGQLLVQLQPQSLEEVNSKEKSLTEIVAFEGSNQLNVKKAFQSLNKQNSYWEAFYLLDNLPPSEVGRIMEELSGKSEVLSVRRVPQVSTNQIPPDDPQYSAQWHLNQVAAVGAWSQFPANILPSTNSIVIAVIDDAVEINHQDFSGNLWLNPGEIPGNGIDDEGNGIIDDRHGADMADLDGDPSPPSTASGSFFNHGTHVAGIANARTHNTTGIASLAYNVRLMSLKCASNSSSDPRQFSILTVIDAIRYATVEGADIINLSLGTTTDFAPLEAAIDDAIAADIAVVAAAGNDNTSAFSYPAAYPGVVAVAASDPSDQKASFSNFGSWVDITAPGVDILSTLPNDSYGTLSGTSMACPLVVSALALMKSNNSVVPNAFLIDCLLDNADNIDAQNPNFIGQLGSGRLNAERAVQCTDGLIAFFEIGTASACVGQSVAFTAAQNAGNSLTYTWDFGDGSPPVSGPNLTVNHTYNGAQAPATITLTVSDGTQSVSTQQTLVVSQCQINDLTQANWFFHNQAALDFSSGAAQANYAPCTFGTFMPTGGSNEPAACISSSNGDLLFYTEGERVWNANHSLLTSSLIGNESMSQGALIVPNPGNSQQYYIFHTNQFIYYSLVNISGTNATMGLTNQPFPIPSSPTYQDGSNGGNPVSLRSEERITAIPHCGGYYIVFIGNRNNAAYLIIYDLTSTGLSYHGEFLLGPGIISAFTFGKMKFSPDGTKFALTSNNFSSGGIYLFDFDRQAGAFSNMRQIEGEPRWGISFSPDSRLLYASRWTTELWQYDLSLINPVGVNIAPSGLPFTINFRGIQLGPDGKIYVAVRYSKFLSTIHFPNDLNNPSMVVSDVSIDPNNTCNNEVGPGLPNFIDAAPIEGVNLDFTYEVRNCFTHEFTSQTCSPTFFWNFGDGNTSTQQNPTHTYANPGTYTVSLNTSQGTVTQTIEVGGLEAEIAGELCADQGGTYTYGTTVNPNYSYQWVPTNGQVQGNDDQALVDIAWTSLPASLKLTVIDNLTGCVVEEEVTIEFCPGLQISKFAFMNGRVVEELFLGQQFDWVVTITNPGPLPITYDYTDLWPQDASPACGGPIIPILNGTPLTGTNITIAAGSTIQLTYQAEICDDPSAVGTYTNCFQALDLSSTTTIEVCDEIKVTDPCDVEMSLSASALCISGGVVLSVAGINSQDYNFLWSTGSTNSAIGVFTPGNYSVTVTNIDFPECVEILEIDLYECPGANCNNCTIKGNLVTNGDFQLGSTTPFLTVLNNSCTCGTGSYCIGSRPSDKCFYLPSLPYDHTLGNSQGKYMIIEDIEATGSHTIWADLGVNVVQGEEYIFSFWHIKNLSNASPNGFQVFDLLVDGQVITTVSTQAANNQEWTEYCGSWVADHTGIVSLSIRRINNSPNSQQPYGIDDISFGGCATCQITAVFTQGITNPSSSNITFFDNSYGNGTIINRAWDFGDPASGANNTSNLQNPTHQFSGPGTYQVCLTVTAIQDGEKCEDTFCQTIRIRRTGSSSGKVQKKTAQEGSLQDVAQNQALLYPNPSSGIVNIELSLIKSQPASVKVFDMKGSLVDKWQTEPLAKGTNELTWNGASKGLRGSFLMLITLEEEVISLPFRLAN